MSRGVRERKIIYDVGKCFFISHMSSLINLRSYQDIQNQEQLRKKLTQQEEWLEGLTIHNKPLNALDHK